MQISNGRLGFLNRRFAFWLSFLLLFMQGCSSLSEESHGLQDGPTLMAIDDSLQQTVSAPEVIPPGSPPEVREALLLPLTPVPAPATENRFDIAVDEAPAATFFMSLVADSDINMVVHPSVTGKVSLKLKNVTVDEAMTLVRQAYGYEYERTRLGY